MNVPHKPVEYVDIAMDTYIYVLNILIVTEILLEVLHVSDEDVAITLEILVALLAFVTNVNNYLVGALNHMRLGIHA